MQTEQYEVFLKKIDAFIGKLKNVQSTERLNNIYQNELQCNNLKKYLIYYVNNPPKCLLVAEAPGWEGCAETGVPFTDEYRFTDVGKQGCKPLQDFSINDISVKHRSNPYKEDAASTVWPILSSLSFFPLMWNIVPFHPKSNVDPTKEEIRKFSGLTEDLKAIFKTVKVTVAVGRKAEEGLKLNDAFYIPVPYPKYAGLSVFKEKMKDISVRFGQI